MRLRWATPADAGALAVLHAAAARTGYRHIFPASSEPPAVEQLRADWETLLERPDARGVVADDAGVVVGSVAVAPAADMPSGLLLQKLHVAPERWGQGVGAVLHDAALATASDRGADAIDLWVLKDNVRARTMYEERGWQLDPQRTLMVVEPDIIDVLYTRLLDDVSPNRRGEPANDESVSTWRQPMPQPASPDRSAIIDEIARQVCALGPWRLRIVIDGYTASGKTSFGHELAAAIRLRGRPTMRASLDDFKKPWRDSIEQGYDRTSGEGYYRNAPDFESARACLLDPAGPFGSGRVALCGHDPLTGIDHREVITHAAADSVLVVDSVFAFRSEYDDAWDLRIWLDIDADLSLRRGIERDGDAEGRDEAERLHRDRYHASEQIYLAEVNPVARADLVIDNRDFARPRLR